MNILIDFETLGTNVSGKVAFCSYCAFDIDVPNSIDHYKSLVRSFKFNWYDQPDYIFNEDVVKFWKKQPIEIRQKMLGDPETGGSILEFCNSFEDYLFETKFTANKDIIWARGISFDLAVLDRLYESIGRNPPYFFWKIRDVRTFIDAANVINGDVNKEGTPWLGKIPGNDNSNHDSDYDVIKDIVQIQSVYKTLKSLSR